MFEAWSCTPITPTILTRDFLYLGGSITAGVIIASVSVAIIQFINSGHKEQWERSQSKVFTNKAVVSQKKANGTAGDFDDYRATYEFVEEYDVLISNQYSGFSRIRVFLLAWVAFFAFLHTSFVFSMSECAPLLPVIVYVTTFGLGMATCTLFWIIWSSNNINGSTNDYSNRCANWCRTAESEATSEVQVRKKNP